VDQVVDELIMPTQVMAMAFDSEDLNEGVNDEELFLEEYEGKNTSIWLPNLFQVLS
jgi:hypothetical protein